MIPTATKQRQDGEVYRNTEGDWEGWTVCDRCEGEGVVDDCYLDQCFCDDPPCIVSECISCRGEGGWTWEPSEADIPLSAGMG